MRLLRRAALAAALLGCLVGASVSAAGDISGDPRFADPAHGDYHLLSDSPAIDVGAANDVALPADLDGVSRVQGAAPDLGAFETSPLPPPPPAPPPPPHAKPVLSNLRVSPRTIRAGSRAPKTSRSAVAARITFTLSENARVKLSFAKAQPGELISKACSRGQGRCTRYVTVGSFTIPGRRGANTGRLAARFSHGKLLTAGSYTLTAIPTDSTNAVGPARTAKLTVIAGRPARRPARR